MKTTLKSGITRHIRIDKDAMSKGEPAISIQTGKDNVHTEEAIIKGPVTITTSTDAPTIQGCATVPGKASITITTDAEIQVTTAEPLDGLDPMKAPIGTKFWYRAEPKRGTRILSVDRNGRRFMADADTLKPRSQGLVEENLHEAYTSVDPNNTNTVLNAPEGTKFLFTPGGGPVSAKYRKLRILPDGTRQMVRPNGQVTNKRIRAYDDRLYTPYNWSE